MRVLRLLPLMLPALLLAACGENHAPTAPVEPDELAASHTAGHKVVNSLADPGDGTLKARPAAGA